VVAGNLTDDPLYVPVIVLVQASIGESGKTYFGDCKMASLETRAHLASSHDYYVCPLSGTQVTLPTSTNSSSRCLTARRH